MMQRQVGSSSTTRMGSTGMPFMRRVSKPGACPPGRELPYAASERASSPGHSATALLLGARPPATRRSSHSPRPRGASGRHAACTAVRTDMDMARREGPFMRLERPRRVRRRTNIENTRRAELSGIRVLLVDPEADTREWLTGVLRRWGAGVTAVASAGEARAALARFRPDVLVTDVDLPGEDGYALVRTIRAVEREVGVNVPAVALTASSHADDRERALRAGFQVHLPKVLAPSELAQVVAQLTSTAEGVRGDG